MNLWIKNTDGKPDAMLTFATAAFLFVLFKLFFNGAEIEGYDFGTIDSDQIAAVLGPTFLAYVGRRYTDAKHASYSDYVVEDETDVIDLDGRGREG